LVQALQKAIFNCFKIKFILRSAGLNRDCISTCNATGHKEMAKTD
jgi:hypothetical protein